MPLRTIPHLLQQCTLNLRLRTKLLLSFFLLSTALICATLLVVRHNAQSQAQQEIDKDARSAGLTIQLVHRQVQMVLARKADLLASLALMRDEDPTTVDDAGNDPWQSDVCNLFVLGDRNGNLQALHASGAPPPASEAQRMLANSVARQERAGWWFAGKQLYQVAIQPFYADAEKKGNPEGYVVIGRLIDEHAVRDLGNLSSSDVVYRFGRDIAASTLSPLNEQEFSRHIRDSASGEELALDNGSYRALTVNLTPGASPPITVTVLKSFGDVTAYLQSLNRLLFGLGITALFAGALLIFAISHTVTQPLGHLVEGVKALERGDFAYPLEPSGENEVSSLTRAFAGMRETLQRNTIHRMQLEEQLRHAQKMEALGRLAGSVAHDFNNLLTVIRGHSELLLDRLPAATALENSAQQICKTADRATALTRQLLLFSRRQVLQPKIVDVNELIADMGKLLRRLIREDIELTVQLRDSLGRVKVDPGQLEQVVLNLVVNAVDAMPAGGNLTIATQNTIVDSAHRRSRPTVEPGRYVLLSVSDTGIGMSVETKAHIFEPFFTTKAPGKGTGLGLATVYGVVRQSGGFIWVESEPGRGSCFDIYLPLTQETAELPDAAPKADGVAASSSGKTILVVEDERDVRELACGFLTAAGFRVLTAEDGWEALETAKRLGSCVDLVLTDVVMPRMRGPELARQLKILRPDARILFMTGYLEQEQEASSLLAESLILQKPFSRESIVQHVNLALKGTRPGNTPAPVS